ncbi:helix-turn-helix domain-containing protein [Flavobacterium sp. NRK F10]|uniref:helix-turn-helix domain-containing protein n=1 Tax=Flavobacterium sp. NRK F10 TaxID=2954931 RepID=UPI002090B70F|nr:helix-turn-helix transcriptional regulator [Flavobacterium sp. NRK F10]MCO6175170.1 helix-turn-helix domain-containing protein [Flavobacterium sp. NRK F10]
MEIGFKIKKLREQKRLSQPELAERLGIAQTTLSNIENGQTQKIDFSLMDKVCKEFDVDFSYFTEGKQINKVKKIDGSINNHGVINLFPEEILDQIKQIIEESKTKDIIIKELEAKLKEKK